MKNCIIIHGSDSKDLEFMREKDFISQNKRHWIPWIKEKLEEKGIETFNPLMPKNWNPSYDEWKNEFEKLPINENSILIGASAGGCFLVRWLSETKRKIQKLILIAPFKFFEGYGRERLKGFSDFEVDKDIKNNIEKLIIFDSSNDAEDLRKSADFYHKELGGKFIELKNKGHFTEKGMGTKEFPELLNEILK